MTTIYRSSFNSIHNNNKLSSSQNSLVIVSDALPLGGTSTFVLNLTMGMHQQTDWYATAAGLCSLGEIGSQIRDSNLPIITPEKSDLLHEDRIENLYSQCANLGARAVVAGLGPCSFDFLRYVPDGCLRIGMIQSDDRSVYDLVERYLPWLDIVAGVSLEICKKMKSRLANDRLSIVHQPYGVTMPDAPTSRQSVGSLRVLYLGRVIEEQKRVKLMTRIMQKTLNEIPHIQWTIAGDGQDLAFMKAQFTEETDRVRFLGNIPYFNVPDILPKHDVYFLCSDYEGLPLSLLESMGAGLVPVVSDLPSGISEVVNDSSGIRVPIDDENAYTEALVRLANNRELVYTMSRCAILQVNKDYSIDAMTKRWVEMLEKHLPSQPPIWQQTCNASAPLELLGKWQFSAAMRPVRKFLKRLKTI